MSTLKEKIADAKRQELTRRTAELNKTYEEKVRRSYEEAQAAMLHAIASTLIEIAVTLKDS